MKKMTEQNLRAAFAGESQAHMRYQIFADKAEEERKPNVARLFRAISFAERVHDTNHFKTFGDLANTASNLQMAIDGETFEVDEMYPAYDAVATLQNEKGAESSIRFALEAEKIHAAMYQTAKQAVAAGQDVDLGAVQICGVCGYSTEGNAPDTCPICGAPKGKFRSF
ncbi:MAG: rubrerythrin family protein [Gemmatimonadota bacterium]|nr:MAG: rubrerythrin family protein [Gemmatimonadota bacterium]